MVTYNFGDKPLWIRNKKNNHGCKNGAFIAPDKKFSKPRIHYKAHEQKDLKGGRK